MATNLIVYRYLGPKQVREARRKLRQSWRVCYLQADPKVASKEFEALPKPRGIWPGAPLISLVESLCQDLVNGSRHLRWAERQYGSKEIGIAFRRRIMEGLLKLFRVLDSIQQVAPEPDTTIHLRANGLRQSKSWDPLIPQFLDLVRSGSLGISPEIPLPLSDLVHRLWVAEAPAWQRLLADLAISTTFLVRRVRLRNMPRKHFHLAIKTSLHDWGVSEECSQPRSRVVDFICDGESFHPNNTMIWAEGDVPTARLAALRSRGYEVASASNICFDPRVAVQALPVLFRFLLYRLASGFSRSFACLACRDLYQAYLQTVALGEYFSPKYLLVYNDLTTASVARTLVLRKTGCRSVFYEHSSHSLIQGVEPDLSYLLYDAVATWGPAMSRYFQRPPGNFGETWEVGCIWSEHARRLREDDDLRKIHTDVASSLKGLCGPSRGPVVSIFDTNPNPVIFHRSDLVQLLNDIEWLASEFPELTFLYKPKLDATYLHDKFSVDVNVKLRDLQAVSNIVVLSAQFETSAAVALADLTISTCFTSTAVESIGCGVKALYYDIFDRSGPESEWGAFWHKFPEFVCRNRDQLKARIHKLMYEMTDKEYQTYLNRYLDDVEGFFDGRAITRLRKKLSA